MDKGSILFAKGIEIGHIFKLGTRYSEAMNAVYLDENGRSNHLLWDVMALGFQERWQRSQNNIMMKKD